MDCRNRSSLEKDSIEHHEHRLGFLPDFSCEGCSGYAGADVANELAKGEDKQMSGGSGRVRVLYSFPLRLGADRICTTAWYQVNGLAAAGAEVVVFPASISRPVRPDVRVSPTLARGKLRLPYKIVGTVRACALHDHVVARRIEKLAGQIDVIHTWPLGALETLGTASRLGIPTVLERCNAHTGFAMEVVQKECDRLGVALPPDHEHAYNEEKLRKEEEEYRLATRVLCPSEFVMKTFLDKGYAREQLARHIYGYDEKVYYPSNEPRDPKRGLTMISVGVCAVRKGLHYALEAWLRSPASKDGTFLIAGEFLPAYREKLASMLAHPSVKVLGHRNDVPDLLRKGDILVLPSIEEGFGLVITEAMGSGCVPLASDACTEICSHMKTGLMHRVGDVEALTHHITMLHEDRDLLERLRATALSAAPEITWTAAGAKLLDVYRETIAAHSAGTPRETGRAREAVCVKSGITA
jgi:glycosyltransferase involved in cell wall biosynthesis